MQVLRGTLLQPVSPAECRVVEHGFVRIGDDGRLAEVGTAPPNAAGGDDGAWILPGFIDAHLHVSQWDRRGIDGLSLSEWQGAVGHPAESRMQDPATAQRLAEAFARGVLASGTTTVAAFGSPFPQEVDQTFAVFARIGLRAIYGMMLNDEEMPADLLQDGDRALDDSRALASRWHNAENGRLRYAFSPRATIHCSEKLMRGAAAMAKMFECHLQTHVAEALEEVSAVRSRFSEYTDEVDIFSAMGLLTDRTLLAHGIFLSGSQRRQLAATQTAVVHCPTANLFRESGLMDYVAHRTAGIRVALGSSIAGGPDPFMPRIAVDALHTAKAVKVHTLPRRSVRVPTPAEAWWMLTRGAAEALGLSQRIGSLEPGFDADCLVVRPEPWLADLPADQRLSALLYTLRPDQIEQVYVAGRRVGPSAP